MTYSITLRSLVALLLISIIPFYGHSQGIITTWVGSGTSGYSGDNGPANLAQLDHPYGITFDAAGNFYIADQGNYAIRKVDGTTGVITTIAGNGTQGYTGNGGPATGATLGSLYGICVDASNNLYITDWTASVVRKISSTTGVITTFAGTGTPGYSGDNGAATNAQLNEPEGLCVYNNNLYITDKIENCIRVVNLTTGIITTIAGNGTPSYTGDGGAATAATLSGPSSICTDTHGNLYISDENNVVIRKITAATGIISTIVGTGTYGFSGNGGPATSAEIGYIQGVYVDQFDNIYINDASCSCRKITISTGIIDIVAGSDATDGYGGDGGNATSGLLNNPSGLCIDPTTGTIVIADYTNMRIRRATQPGFFPSSVSNIPEQGALAIYPNPSSGRFYIQMQDNTVDAIIELYSVTGEKVYSTDMKNAAAYIDVSRLPNGDYITIIRTSAGKTYNRKITVSK